MRPKNINEVCHQWIESILNKNMIAVDATCGNGNDTYFLANQVLHVYAFDIQPQAIFNTKEKTSKFSNITFILDGHQTMDQYIHTSIDLCIFNFGYLPKGNEAITTLPETSSLAIQKAYALLNPNGYLFLTCYIGHTNGKEEHESILHTIHHLPHCKLIKEYTYVDRKDAPILYWIQKQ